jgi:hypothetical protein
LLFIGDAMHDSAADDARNLLEKKALKKKKMRPTFVRRGAMA